MEIFLLNATYTKILIYIEKKWKKCLGPGPRAPMVATPMQDLIELLTECAVPRWFFKQNIANTKL